LGTLGFQTPTTTRDLPNTTPFAVDLYGMLAEARDASVNAMAIEVSSHALDQHRADGLEFDAAVFTNFTQDHLDYHETMEAYAAAKWRLFSAIPGQSDKAFRAAFNVGDELGSQWARRYESLGSPIRFATSETLGPLEIGLLPLSVKLHEIEGVLGFHDHGVWKPVSRVTIPLGGNYNVENAASAAAGMLALGYPVEEIAELLPQVHAVPGRFEAVGNDRGIGVIVDYAHTPDALEKLISSVRELGANRVITVFGCGGDRDRTKRPKMARAASLMSDLTVATSDNPRTEDPQAILNEVSAGIVEGRDHAAIVDRGEAIAYAVGQARQGDVVIVAGKGHETYQIIGHEKIDMDDRDLIRRALA
jgi:UDP-N-acetylmuramoyl-L-alanyl-D-glutamate--2,6-diaminopimelate ligase